MQRIFANTPRSEASAFTQNTIPFWTHFPNWPVVNGEKNSLYRRFKQFVHFASKKQKSLDFSRLPGSPAIVSILTFKYGGDDRARTYDLFDVSEAL